MTTNPVRVSDLERCPKCRAQFFGEGILVKHLIRFGKDTFTLKMCFKRTSINDVTQFWTPRSSIVTRFITITKVLSSNNPWPPPPPHQTLTTFMNDLWQVTVKLIHIFFAWIVLTKTSSSNRSCWTEGTAFRSVTWWQPISSLSTVPKS